MCEGMDCAGANIWIEVLHLGRGGGREGYETLITWLKSKSHPKTLERKTSR